MRFEKLFFTCLILMQCHGAAAFADGGGSTGGGLAAINGVLLDFDEAQESPMTGLVPFDPIAEPAFQNRLLPLLAEADKKLPGVAKGVLNPFHNTSGRLEWFFTDDPISSSGDECSLLKKDRIQIAAQVGNKVVISRKWWNGKDPTNQAGLLAHEFIMHSLGVGNCSTTVRKMVRTLFNVSNKNEEELMQDLAELVRRNQDHVLTRTKSELAKKYIAPVSCKKGLLGTANDIDDHYYWDVTPVIPQLRDEVFGYGIVSYTLFAVNNSNSEKRYDRAASRFDTLENCEKDLIRFKREFGFYDPTSVDSYRRPIESPGPESSSRVVKTYFSTPSSAAESGKASQSSNAN